MMNFKFVCILVLLCIFINMSVVFASNETNMDNNMENNNNNVVDTKVNIKEVKGNSFKDIQDVIDSSEDNDVIILNGTYYCPRKAGQIFVNKSITIEGRNNTVLNGSGLSRVFYINADNVVLKNLEITNGYKKGTTSISYLDPEHDKYYGGGIYWRGNNGTLIDCDVWGNKIERGQYGAIYWEGNNGRIINSFFNCNLAYGDKVTPGNVISGTIRGILNGTIYHYFELFENSSMHSYDSCDYCLIKDAWVNSDFNFMVSNVSVYSNVGNVKIKFKLSYKDVPFCNETINVTAFNKNFTIVTDESGEAYLDVPNQLNAGEYIIHSFYDNCSFNSTLNIADLSCILSADTINFYYNNNKKYYVKITSNDSQNLGNIGVALKIANVILYGVSDNNGIVKFNIPKLNNGKYDIEVNVYKNGKSNVLKSSINIKKVNSEVKHSLKHKKLKINIIDKVSKSPLSNIKILVKITHGKKKTKKTLTTNKKGQISLKLKKGKNKIQINSLNNNYNIKYKIKKIKV